jgi:O-antigen/teichoic acid export membrane protein
MISAVTTQLPIMLMPTLFGSAVAGTYALAQRVVLQPVYLINYSIQTVFWAGAARAFREEPHTVRPRFFDTSAAVALLLVPAFAVAPFAPALFALCFGEAWRESGVYAGILLIPAITIIVAASTNCLHVCGYNNWQTVIEAGQLFACATVLAVAWAFGVDPVTTVYGVAVSGVLAHLVLWCSNVFVLRRVARRDVPGIESL